MIRVSRRLTIKGHRADEKAWKVRGEVALICIIMSILTLFTDLACLVRPQILEKEITLFGQYFLLLRLRDPVSIR